MKIFESSNKLKDSTNCGLAESYNCEAYYFDDNIYFLMSGKPGIVLYNYKKSRPKFNLITNEDKEVPHYYSMIQYIKNQLIIFDSDWNGNIILWSFYSDND